MEFPRIVYRAGGDWQLESGRYSVRQVDSRAEFDEALADGWHPDQYAAKAAHEAAQVIDVQAVEVSDQRPTRDELEQMASTLGIAFGPRVSDKKLGEAIAAKRAEKAAA